MEKNPPKKPEVVQDLEAVQKILRQDQKQKTMEKPPPKIIKPKR